MCAYVIFNKQTFYSLPLFMRKTLYFGVVVNLHTIIAVQKCAVPLKKLVFYELPSG